MEKCMLGEGHGVKNQNGYNKYKKTPYLCKTNDTTLCVWKNRSLKHLYTVT